MGSGNECRALAGHILHAKSRLARPASTQKNAREIGHCPSKSGPVMVSDALHSLDSMVRTAVSEKAGSNRFADMSQHLDCPLWLGAPSKVERNAPA